MAGPALHEAMATQLGAWRATLGDGASRSGWKIGFNLPAAQERAGIHEPIVGHMTSATEIAPGGEFALGDAVNVLIEPEIAVRVDGEGAIVAVAPAIEVTDVFLDPQQVEQVLAGNIFHRGVVFGDQRPFTGNGLPPTRVRMLRNGAVEQEADLRAAAGDVPALVDLVARTLAEHGEALQDGERIICGTLTTPIPPRPGDAIANDVGPLGRVEIGFAR